MDTRHFRLERDSDGLAWLHLDKQGASTNTLSADVLDELDIQLSALAQQPPRGLIILSDKPNGFIAGADVHAFATLSDEATARALIERGQAVMDRLATLPFPTLALIHGFCLGGGLELALACRYRIAEDDLKCRLGLPEVKLGIHPGFGGTVRLPPLIGTPAALDLMLSGRTVTARAAAKLGLVDHALPRRHWLRGARELILTMPTPRRARGWKALAGHSLVRPLVARMSEKKLAARVRREHYPAPYALLDLWRRHADDPHAMMTAEARSVAQLITGDTAQHLVRVFFLQERLKSLGRDGFTPKHVHVIGAGVMGGDIAAWCALRGYTVSLQDQNAERIAPAIGRAHKLYRERLKEPRAAQAALDRLIPDIAGDGVPHADVVIEAIFENAAAKQGLLRALEPRLKPNVLITTNTSSIPLETLGEALRNPERLVGLHFFNPVAKMQLVEIVRGAHTDDACAQRAAAFARTLDRLPLPVASAPGFLVNRVLMPYLMEAVQLAEEGVPLAAIDAAATAFGMPMGPILLADTVGLDICLSVANILSGALGLGIPARLQELVTQKKLGKKSGEGFYRYEKGQPVTGTSSSDSRSEVIAERLILRLLNEAVRCLREGVVDDAALLDAGMIFGTGFAPFRGGPLHHARSRGIATIQSRLTELAAQHGERFTPDAGWQQADSLLHEPS